jgi:apolipoprotein N-acyltransferase
MYSALSAWVSVLLLAVSTVERDFDSYGIAFLYGVIVYFTACAWLVPVIGRYAEIPLAVAVFAAFAVISVSSLQFVVFAFVLRGLNRISFFRKWYIALPSAWASAEVLFPQFIPWSLGATQQPFLHIIQVVDLLGGSLLSWLMLWWANSAVGAFQKFINVRHGKDNDPKPLFPLVSFALAVFMVVLAYGQFRILATDKLRAGARPLRLALVQADLHPISDYRQEKVEANVKRHRELSLPVFHETLPDLLIWPESSVTYDYLDGQEHIEKGSAVDPFPGIKVPLIFGGQTRSIIAYEKKPSYYNSVYMIMPSGEISGVYHKQVLFPFSEKLPLSGVFPWTDLASKRPFVQLQGESQEPLRIVIPRINAGDAVRIGAVICFEDLHSKVFLNLVSDHLADFLLVLTNDNWFLDSIAAEQHHFLASLRAVENRRDLVRVGGDGITGVVDASGRSLQQLSAFKPGVLLTRGAPVLLQGKTVYAQFGYLLSNAFAVAFLLLALLPRMTKVRNG